MSDVLALCRIALAVNVTMRGVAKSPIIDAVSSRETFMRVLFSVLHLTALSLALLCAASAKASEETQLVENYAAAQEEILRLKPSTSKGRYVLKGTVATTMGPGIPLDTTKTRNLLSEDAS